MKLFKPEKDEHFLTKKQWRKVLLATSIIIIAVYVVAMFCSFFGSDYFIFNYTNEWTDKVEEFLRAHDLYSFLMWGFNTVETFIISFFVLKQKPKRYLLLAYYALPFSFALIPNAKEIPSFVWTLYSTLGCLALCLLQNIINVEYRKLPFTLLRFFLALVVDFLFQFAIYQIKSGVFSVTNHIPTLVETLCYTLELDIALSIVLLTIALFLDKEKGEQLCQTYLHHGSSSQTLTKHSQRSKWKTLTKKTKRKIIFLYVRITMCQTGGFLLLMILPFLFGKVFEFLLMYLCFAIVRYILGFKYSLHYTSEMICITVGVVTFGLLTLIVPHFAVDVVLAVLFGTTLGILLHLSYKYKSMNKFMEKIGKDRFAELYVIFNGNFNPAYIKRMCNHYMLTLEETNIVSDYIAGEKISYLAYKYSYGKTRFNEILDEIIAKLHLIQ